MGDIEPRTRVDLRIFNSPWLQSLLAIGYQGILDAFPKPSDDGFLIVVSAGRCGIFLKNLGILNQTLDELISGANVGPILIGTANEIHHEYASPCISNRR